MAFDREKTLQSAQKLIEKRKYDRAILEYQRVVQHDPNDARTLLRIGDLQARLGSHPQAIATYDRVALYYAGRGFSLKAIAVLKQIRELIDRHAPQLADQYSHVSPKLAQIYAELGLVSDALATYDTVARRLQSRGRDRDAVEIIRRMVALERSNPLPYLRLAEALCRVGRLDEAIEHFWSAAQLLTGQRRSEDALKVLERILHFRQDVRVARVAAELYLQRGTREAGLQALSRLQSCFEANPKDLETLALLARAFDAIQQPAKGVEVYKEMVRIASESGEQELYERYAQHLRRIAPNDPDVLAMAAAPGVPTAQLAASEEVPESEAPASIAEEEIEFLEDDSVVTLPNDSPTSLAPEPPVRGERPRVPRAPQPSAAGGRQPSVSPDAELSDAQKKALVDAESFRGLRLYSKAATTLNEALWVTPRSIELRAALQQILLEAGDHTAAMEQMLAVAQLYLERGSHRAAEVELRHVLELSPGSQEAAELMSRVRALAAASSVTSLRPSAEPSRGGEHQAFELRARVSRPAEAPLPSYELEENEVPPVPGGEAARSEPLPRFQLDPASSAEPDVAVAAAAGDGGAALANGRESIQAALEEAHFFSSRGLYQDAGMILRDRLEQHPGAQPLIEALARLEPELESESGTRDLGRLRPDASRAASAASAEVSSSGRGEHRRASSAGGVALNARFSTEGMLDVASVVECDADDDLVSQLELEQTPDRQVDVDEVFAKFKQGVQAQVSDSDSATHYDLGVAYKEMGLLEDAAREFEIASRDPSRECNCLAMMGMMYRQRGELDKAAEAYVRGLSAAKKTVAQEVSLFYELSAVYEAKGDVEEAIYYLERIATGEPGYRDVAERLAHLKQRLTPYARPARAINDDRDFDASFDDE